MNLIVGLGNPGPEYTNTRHNVGYMVIDELQKEMTNHKPQISNKSKILIFKSKNFMNESGRFVKELSTRYSLSPNDLYIVHDDLDIKLGEFKIQFAKGPKDHNGLKSIDEALGTDEYWHVRVGVDNRSQVIGERVKGEEYVLQNFTNEEKEILQSVIKKIVDKLDLLFEHSF